jgi:hypothetical protein
VRDSGGNTLGTLISMNPGANSNLMVFTSTGHVAQFGFGGTFINISSVYWSGAGCTGTPYAGGSTTGGPRYAKMLVYSFTTQQTYTYSAAATNLMATPVTQASLGITIQSVEDAATGACSATTSATQVFPLTVTAQTSMGLPAPGATRIAVPLQIP